MPNHWYRNKMKLKELPLVSNQTYIKRLLFFSCTHFVYLGCCHIYFLSSFWKMLRKLCHFILHKSRLHAYKHQIWESTYFLKNLFFILSLMILWSISNFLNWIDFSAVTTLFISIYTAEKKPYDQQHVARMTTIDS